MRRNRKAVFLLLAAVAMLTVPAMAWKAVKNESGIVVYTRPVKGSDIDEFRGVGTVDAPMEVVNNVLDDVAGLSRWMPECVKSYLISRKGNVIILYNEIKTPWPLNNRDVVVESKIIKKKGKIVRTLKATTHPKAPKKSGKVRITELKGRWILTAKGEKTDVVYQVKSNPAGNIPAMIANSASKDLPFRALKGLRRMVKKPKYQE